MSANVVILPSGRRIVDTGRVQIGIRSGERPDSAHVVDFRARRPPLSADAERIQTALLASNAIVIRGAMRPNPHGRIGPIPLDTSLRARLVRWYQKLVLQLRKKL